MLKRSARGFTLIELMIGLVLLGILLVLAMPSFTTMFQNMRLRTTAETVLSGLQSARAEALKRNQSVDFLLTAGAIDPGNYAGMVANTSGPGWAVRVDPAECTAPTPTECFIDGKAGLEGSNQAAGSTPIVQIAASHGLVKFNALGRALDAAGTPVDVQIDVTNPSGGTCKVDGGPMRCLRIVVTASGRVRMCDPGVTAAC